MTTLNIKNLNAFSLLADWTSGQGATGKAPDTWEHVQDGMLHGKSISLGLLTAIAEMKTIGTVVSFDTAIEHGYLSKNHQDQHETAVGKHTAKSDVLATTKVYLTALEYKENCIKLALDSKNLDTIISLIDSIDSITSATTKIDLTALLKSAKSIFVSDDQQAVFNVKFEDESASAIKFQALTDNNFVDIRPTGKGTYVGVLALPDLLSLAILPTLSYTRLDMVDLKNDTWQIEFKDTIQA